MCSGRTWLLNTTKRRFRRAYSTIHCAVSCEAKSGRTCFRWPHTGCLLHHQHQWQHAGVCVESIVHKLKGLLWLSINLLRLHSNGLGGCTSLKNLPCESLQSQPAPQTTQEATDTACEQMIKARGCIRGQLVILAILNTESRKPAGLDG